MSDLLYLDTARLGRMAPGAAAAVRDFVALAGDEGGGLYFDRFLTGGLADCPVPFAARYPGLGGWRGVGPLKVALRALAGDRTDHPVLVASRSAALMEFAARFLFHPCRNVLTTDLDWPPYAAALAAEALAAGRAVTTVAVREAVLSGRLGADDLLDLLCDRYVRSGCDGLYLTAVSHLGVRTPVERLVGRLEARHLVRAVVVDGAQEFCQVRPAAASHCDLYLAGSHKWLGGHYPLGLAFYGRETGRGRVESVLAALLASGELDDPLLRFSARLEAAAGGPVIETVNLAPLFATQGAVADLLGTDPPLGTRLENARAAAETAAGAGWEPLLPAPALRSGILLARSRRVSSAAGDAAAVRAALRDAGIAATTYDGGLVRLSMPGTGWRPGDLDRLGRVLAAID